MISSGRVLTEVAHPSIKPGVDTKSPTAMCASHSPISVVGISKFIEDIESSFAKNKHDDTLKAPELNLRYTADESSSSPPLLPPLDSVTASCPENDDSDSLSSVSSATSEDDTSIPSPQTKRSIFAHYWVKTGQTPEQLLKKDQPCFPSPSETEITQPLDTDQVPPPEASSSSKSPPREARRSMFGDFFFAGTMRSSKTRKSFDLLGLLPPLPRPIQIPRKAKSASALYSNSSPTVSILRYNNHIIRQQLRRRSRNVTFDTKVDVVLFDTGPSCRDGVSCWPSDFSIPGKDEWMKIFH